MDLTSLTNEMSILFRSNLEEIFENEDTESLTPDLSIRMIKQIKSLVRKIGVLTLEQFFQDYDVDEKKMTIDGESYYLKYKSDRDFLTSLGKIRLHRSIYQRSSGGKRKKKSK